MIEPVFLSPPFGPDYDVDSVALKKFRRVGTISKAYGHAVLAAVLASQASQLRRAGESLPRPNCASGTAHSTGKAILKAVAQTQRARLLACPDQIRRERSPIEWRELYQEAMAQKRLNMSRAEMLVA